MNLTKFKQLPLVAAIAAAPVMAFDGAETDYTTDSQSRHVWNESLEPIELVNSILCFTKQMRGSEFINAGPYLVLADEAACFDDGGDDASPSSAAGNNPAYMEVVVDITQADDDSPLQVSAWMPDMGDDDGAQAIKFKAEIREGASDDNPFGSFTFNFDFYNDIADPTPNGGGEVQTIDDLTGQIGFTLFEDNGNGSSQSASVVMSEDRSAGVALTASSWNGFGRAYGLAFNDTHVLVQSANSYDDLGYRAGDNSGACLSRTSFEDSVWRYDLYNSVSGERVEVNSGFSFRYDSNGDDQADSYGHVGYWGLWAENEEAIANGDVISVEDRATNEVSDYTVVKAPGRLIKHSVETLSIADVEGINFNVWDGAAYESGFDNWVVRYLTIGSDNVAVNGFYRIAGTSYTENGSSVIELPQAELIELQDFETLYMHSDQLGGEVKYLAGEENLTYYRQEFVNGSDVSSLGLVCFDRCPKGTLEAVDLRDFDGANGPFVDQSAGLAVEVAYEFAVSGDHALTLIRAENGEAVRYAPGLTEEALAESPHSWGLRSGPMVTGAVAMEIANQPWLVYDAEVITEYYVWETGPNQWNQMTAVRDVTGAIAEFDKPIQFSYRHSSLNDRSGDAGEFDEQLFMVNYGGNGDFWGIPNDQADGERWLPLFNIADGVVMGENDEFVIKAREIEQTMSDATGECGSLTIDDPAVAVPTATVGSADIGDMPAVTDAPAVIAGVIQEGEE